MGEVELHRLLLVGDLKPDESRHLADPGHGQTVAAQPLLEHRKQRSDLVSLGREEVEVSGLTLDQPVRDEGGTTAQRETVRLGQLGQEQRHTPLQRGQHRRLRNPLTEQAAPRVADRLGQEQLVEDPDQLGTVHVAPLIGDRPFA